MEAVLDAARSVYGHLELCLFSSLWVLEEHRESISTLPSTQ